MILKINESQLDAFRRQQGENFTTRVVAFLREQFAEYRQVPDVQMKSAVTAFTERAATYGLETEIMVVTFVLAAHYLGGDFDSKNQYCLSVLTDSCRTSEWKANWLEAMCLLIEGKRERGEV